MNNFAPYGGNYPAMSRLEWENAPFNEREIPETEMEVEYNASVCRRTMVSTTDYVPGDTFVEYDDGHAVTVREDDDFSSTDWLNAYKESKFSLMELINILGSVAANLEQGWTPPGSKKYWSDIREACSEFEAVDEFAELP